VLPAEVKRNQSYQGMPSIRFHIYGNQPSPETLNLNS